MFWYLFFLNDFRFAYDLPQHIRFKSSPRQMSVVWVLIFSLPSSTPTSTLHTHAHPFNHHLSRWLHFLITIFVFLLVFSYTFKTYRLTFWGREAYIYATVVDRLVTYLHMFLMILLWSICTVGHGPLMANVALHDQLYCVLIHPFANRNIIPEFRNINVFQK